MKPIIDEKPHLYVAKHPEYFEDDVSAFEQSDKNEANKKRIILFVGSSNISEWKNLEEDMRPLKVLNRGISGTQMSHLVYFYQRLIPPYNPKAIIIHAGGNDLEPDTKKTAGTVLKDFEKLVQLIRADFSIIPIYFLALTPSIKRQHRWKEMAKANELIKRFCDNNSLTFIDVTTPLVTKRLVPKIFKNDGLHFSELGYKIWTDTVKPILLTHFA